MEKCLRALLVGAALLVAAPASASVIVLDFKGIGNLSPVGDFYDGGGGTNYGIEFSPAALAVVDEDAGGTGNIANEPPPDTVMSFLDANDATLNVPAGFDTGLSFFDTSSTAASVDDGLDATDNLLGTLSLVAESGDNCTGVPNGDFCNWTPIGVAFGGIAKPIDVGARTNRTALDDITLGSADPVGASVAEPAILAVLGAGLGLAAVMLGRLVGPGTHRRVDGSPGACDEGSAGRRKSQKKKPAPPK